MLDYNDFVEHRHAVMDKRAFDPGNALGTATNAALSTPGVAPALLGAGIGAVLGIGSGHKLRNALIGAGLGGVSGLVLDSAPVRQWMQNKLNERHYRRTVLQDPALMERAPSDQWEAQNRDPGASGLLPMAADPWEARNRNLAAANGW